MSESFSKIERLIIYFYMICERISYTYSLKSVAYFPSLKWIAYNYNNINNWVIGTMGERIDSLKSVAYCSSLK